MISEIIPILFRFFILVLVQVTVLNNIQFSGYLNPYLYVLFILMLPFETPGWLLLFTGFFTGLTIDMFSDTLGMHAAACVFMAFCRPYVLKLISPRDGYEFDSHPTLQSMGLNWMITYASLLVLAHHTVLFYVEVFRFSEFFSTFFRILLSSIFTLLLIFITQYFFYYKTRSRV